MARGTPPRSEHVCIDGQATLVWCVIFRAWIKRGYYNRVIMKMLIGALTVGTILVGVSALAADAQHLRQPKHDDPERLRMIRECMGMHNKHRGDMPYHSGGKERLYRACMATRGHHG